jgi:hypothetical protein
MLNIGSTNRWPPLEEAGLGIGGVAFFPEKIIMQGLVNFMRHSLTRGLEEWDPEDIFSCEIIF